MSAQPEAEADLKAGHAPAVKVGGMRVVQHKKEGEKPEGPTMTPEEEAEFGSGSSPPKSEKHNAQLLVSGAVTKGDKDFTAQALKSYHEKPQPQHDARPRPQQITKQINQPR